jgi:hypothetical protein
MSVRTAFRATLGGLALVASSSCSFPEMPPDARALPDKYYEAIAADQFDAALNLYSAHFFEATPRAQLLESLKALRERCGSTTAHSLVTTTVMNEFGSNTIRANVIFDVTYARCHSTERMSIVKLRDGESKIDAFAAQIDPAPPVLPAPAKPSAVTT